MRLSFLSLVISERSNELHNQQSTICTGISYPQKSDPTTNPPIPKNWFEKIADTSKALAINEEGAMYQGDITEAGFSRHPRNPDSHKKHNRTAKKSQRDRD